MDFIADLEVLFVFGRLFLSTGHALIYVATGQLTMREDDKVEVFDVYKAIKLSTIYEELSTIMVINLELELPLIISKDTLERDLVGHDIFRDTEAYDMIPVLDVASIIIFTRILSL